MSNEKNIEKIMHKVLNEESSIDELLVYANGYFEPIKEPLNKKRIITGLWLIALSLVIFGLSMVLKFGFSTAFGIFLFMVGIIICLSRKEEYVGGKSYDKITSALVKKLGTDEKEYLGLDVSEVEEIDPIQFEGYRFIGANKYKQDSEDEIWRSDLFEKVVVFFTQNEIHIYKISLNVLAGKVTETTDVLFYEDVVSVSTTNEMERIKDKSIEYISFNLVSRGGNAISIALKGDDTKQRSINAMRAMIKEKKIG